MPSECGDSLEICHAQETLLKILDLDIPLFGILIKLLGNKEIGLVQIKDRKIHHEIHDARSSPVCAVCLSVISDDHIAEEGVVVGKIPSVLTVRSKLKCLLSNPEVVILLEEGCSEHLCPVLPVAFRLLVNDLIANEVLEGFVRSLIVLIELTVSGKG